MAGGYDNEDVQAELEEIRRRRERQMYAERDRVMAERAARDALAKANKEPPADRNVAAARAALGAHRVPNNVPTSYEDE